MLQTFIWLIANFPTFSGYKQKSVIGYTNAASAYFFEGFLFNGASPRM